MTDYDDLSAEFYDLSAAGSDWPLVLEFPDAARTWMRPDLGPLVDLGAGTGRSSIALAEAFPEAEVLAVEPSRAMRAVLTSRVLAREDLRQRVTVVPGDVASAPLPARWGGVTARGLAGHLDPAQRRTLWSLLAERLADGAGAVVDQVPAEPPEPGRREIYRSTILVGRYDYHVTIDVDLPASGPAANLIRCTTTDRTDGTVIADHTDRAQLFVVTVSGLADELDVAGLRADAIDEQTLLVSRRTSA